MFCHNFAGGLLLRDEGWSLIKISQALRLHNDTVSRYIADYLNNDKLANSINMPVKNFSASTFLVDV